MRTCENPTHNARGYPRLPVAPPLLWKFFVLPEKFRLVWKLERHLRGEKKNFGSETLASTKNDQWGPLKVEISLCRKTAAWDAYLYYPSVTRGKYPKVSWLFDISRKFFVYYSSISNEVSRVRYRKLLWWLLCSKKPFELRWVKKLRISQKGRLIVNQRWFICI